MSYRRPIPHFVSGPLTPQDAQALNQLAEDVYRLAGGISATPPLAMSDDVGGLSVTWQQPNQIRDVTTDGFWGRITTAAGGSNGYSYGFIEQYQADDGTPSDMTNGRSGTQTVLPAVPVDKSTSVPLNSVVWLWLSQKKKCYNFSLGGSGGGGGNTGSTPIVTGVT